MANLHKDSNNPICGIYCILSPSGKIYIGQSVNIKTRLNTYKGGWGSRHSHRLHNSFKKYTYEAHSVSILLECEESQLNRWEEFYIALFDCFGTDHGLNLRSGGGSSRHSVESGRRISKAKKGIDTLTPEQREKLRQCNIGRVRPQYERDKISATHKSIVKTDAHLRKIKESRHSSEKVKATMIALQNGNKKKVINTETGEVYSSAKEASVVAGTNVVRLIANKKGVYKYLAAS